MFKRPISWIVIVTFVFSVIGPYEPAHADVLNLPAPGSMVNVSPDFEPALIKGLIVHKDNPFLFDFIVDPGQSQLSQEALKEQAGRMIKYFFAALTVPDKDVWVNLSPYEKDRMVPASLGQTAMGRDLLAQDYLLKQLTASLIYPQSSLGQAFWQTVYAKAKAMYGTTQIPVNTFNKVWIVPQRIGIYEHGQTAYIVDSHLKVMLEEDYLATTKHNAISNPMPSTLPSESTIEGESNPGKSLSAAPDTSYLGSQIIRQIVLPEIEKEVNEGRNFATLRQIVYAQALAVWFKHNLRQALLNQVYANKSTVKGIDSNSAAINEAIYQQYLRAYKKGVFNYIKEDPVDGVIAIPQGEAISTRPTIARKYFSGGYDGKDVTAAMVAVQLSQRDAASLSTGTTNLIDDTVAVVTGSDKQAAQALQEARILDEKASAAMENTEPNAATNSKVVLVKVDGEWVKGQITGIVPRGALRYYVIILEGKHKDQELEFYPEDMKNAAMLGVTGIVLSVLAAGGSLVTLSILWDRFRTNNQINVLKGEVRRYIKEGRNDSDIKDLIWRIIALTLRKKISLKLIHPIDYSYHVPSLDQVNNVIQNAFNVAKAGDDFDIYYNPPEYADGEHMSRDVELGVKVKGPAADAETAIDGAMVASVDNDTIQRVIAMVRESFGLPASANIIIEHYIRGEAGSLESDNELNKVLPPLPSSHEIYGDSFKQLRAQRILDGAWLAAKYGLDKDSVESFYRFPFSIRETIGKSFKDYLGNLLNESIVEKIAASARNLWSARIREIKSNNNAQQRYEGLDLNAYVQAYENQAGYQVVFNKDYGRFGFYYGPETSPYYNSRIYWSDGIDRGFHFTFDLIKKEVSLFSIEVGTSFSIRYDQIGKSKWLGFYYDQHKGQLLIIFDGNKPPAYEGHNIGGFHYRVGQVNFMSLSTFQKSGREYVPFKTILDTELNEDQSKPPVLILPDDEMAIEQEIHRTISRDSFEMQYFASKTIQPGRKITLNLENGDAVSGALKDITGNGDNKSVVFEGKQDKPVKWSDIKSVLIDAAMTQGTQPLFGQAPIRILFADAPAAGDTTVQAVDQTLDPIRQAHPGRRIEIIKATGVGQDPQNLLKVIQEQKPAVVFVRSATNAFGKKGNPEGFDYKAFVNDAYANGVRVVVRMGAGVDNIDADYAAQKGISVIRTHGNADSVADLTLYLMASLPLTPAFGGSLSLKWPEFSNTDPQEYEDLIRSSKKWQKGITDEEKKTAVANILQSLHPGRNPAESLARILNGKTIGLLGFGPIAQAVAEKLQEFKKATGIHFSVMASARSLDLKGPDSLALAQRLGVIPVSRQELFKMANIISLHVPGGQGLGVTDQELNRRNIQAVINTARADLVSVDAAKNFVERGGAFSGDFDLTPEYFQLMSDHPKVLILPHIAASTANAGAGVEENTVQIAPEIVGRLLGDAPSGVGLDIVNGIGLKPVDSAMKAEELDRQLNILDSQLNKPKERRDVEYWPAIARKTVGELRDRIEGAKNSLGEEKYRYLISRLDTISSQHPETEEPGNSHDSAMNGGIDLSEADAALRVTKDADGGVEVNVDPALIARVEREGISEAIPVIINMKPADLQTLFQS